MLLTHSDRNPLISAKSQAFEKHFAGKVLRLSSNYTAWTILMVEVSINANHCVL